MTDTTAHSQPRERRPPRPQTVLTVVETIRLGPHLIRIIAGSDSPGDPLADFAANTATDKYVKLFFVKPELNLEPPYDVAALRQSLPQEDWPVVRTYTVRRVDHEDQNLAIDFVVHGDEGVAGPWAAAAQPGDRVVLAGPGGGYRPEPEASRHFFAGDLSAVPAIAAALESLADDAVGSVHIEVDGEADIIDLERPQGVTVEWILADGSTDTLARALDSDLLSADGVQVFAHGEREAMKAVREVLRRRDVPREPISLSGYWARGRTEDVFQAEKRTPTGVV